MPAKSAKTFFEARQKTPGQLCILASCIVIRNSISIFYINPDRYFITHTRPQAKIQIFHQVDMEGAGGTSLLPAQVRLFLPGYLAMSGSSALKNHGKCAGLLGKTFVEIMDCVLKWFLEPRTRGIQYTAQNHAQPRSRVRGGTSLLPVQMRLFCQVIRRCQVYSLQ